MFYCARLTQDRRHRIDLVRTKTCRIYNPLWNSWKPVVLFRTFHLMRSVWSMTWNLSGSGNISSPYTKCLFNHLSRKLGLRCLWTASNEIIEVKAAEFSTTILELLHFFPRIGTGTPCQWTNKARSGLWSMPSKSHDPSIFSMFRGMLGSK